MTGVWPFRVQSFKKDLQDYGDAISPYGEDGFIRPPEWWPESVPFIPLRAFAATLDKILEENT